MGRSRVFAQSAAIVIVELTGQGPHKSKQLDPRSTKICQHISAFEIILPSLAGNFLMLYGSLLASCGKTSGTSWWDHTDLLVLN